jgi:uncharacterized protein YdeI (YjbR/CyaY-like superfamily)
VEESIKWGFPHFTYKNDMMCHMASFKKHCVFGFWKAPLMKDAWLVENAKTETAMGHYGKITSLKELPADSVIMRQVKEAMKLNDEGKKVPKEKFVITDAIEAPEYFLKAIKKNKTALAVWEKFSNSCKKEYVEWITEAKREETRNNRVAQAVTWMAEGKDRNWKYKK